MDVQELLATTQGDQPEEPATPLTALGQDDAEFSDGTSVADLVRRPSLGPLL